MNEFYDYSNIFPIFKCEEETYYETISTQINQQPSTSEIKSEQICEQSIDDSVIALTKDTNEIILGKKHMFFRIFYPKKMH